jgi:signal transduction histidine kinase
LSRPIAALLGIREMAYLMTEDKQILDLFDLSRKTILGMDRMARKLQSISEITSTQHTEDVLDFSLIFGEIWLRLRVLLAEKKNEIISDLDLPRLLVGTPYFVTVILENLIENALLFGYPDTGVIQLSIKELNQTLLLEVKDNGKGIDPKYQAHIFDMYFRAHETSQGNGLGLYVVRKITEKCKGKIEFESQVGVGSAFRVTIPVGYSVQN